MKKILSLIIFFLFLQTLGFSAAVEITGEVDINGKCFVGDRYMVDTTPLKIPNCELWFDAYNPDYVIYDSVTKKVSSWLDKSGNGRHATQVTPSTQPTYVQNRLNGHSTLIFNNHILNTTYHVPIAGGISVWVVLANTPSSSGFRYIVSQFQSPQREWAVGRYENNFLARYQGPNEGNNNYVIAAGIADSYLAYINDTSTGFIYQNGVLKDTNAFDQYDGTLGTIIIGRLPSDSPWVGDIAEIIIYSDNNSASDRQILEAYIADKWGI